jgi:hypothetical protein
MLADDKPIISYLIVEIVFILYICLILLQRYKKNLLTQLNCVKRKN